MYVTNTSNLVAEVKSDLSFTLLNILVTWEEADFVEPISGKGCLSLLNPSALDVVGEIETSFVK